MLDTSHFGGVASFVKKAAAAESNRLHIFLHQSGPMRDAILQTNLAQVPNLAQDLFHLLAQGVMGLVLLSCHTAVTCAYFKVPLLHVWLCVHRVVRVGR